MIASGTPVLTSTPDTTGQPAPVVVPERDLQAEIDSGPFWPKVYPDQARLEMRLDGTINATRLRSALIEAVALVNHELTEWATQHQANGITRLADTTSARIDLVSLAEIRYLRAVHCYAAANLGERLRNFDSTAEGHKRADALSDPIDDHRRDARWAVSDLLGRSRTVVDLI